MGKKIDFVLPLSGKVVPLSEVNDYLFNKKIMGEGAAVIPNDNVVYSPVDGEIAVLNDSRHSVIIKSDDGLEILIHIGLDSIKLEGRGFGTYVKVGDKVKVHDKILFFDKDFVERRSSLVTPVVITNTDAIGNIEINFKAETKDDNLLEIELK